MRVLLAAGLLRKVDNILQIGAPATPIFRFLDGAGRRVRAVDPGRLEADGPAGHGAERLDYRCLELDPFDGAPFALALFGLDRPMSYKLKHYLRTADLAVVEVADTDRRIFRALCAELTLHLLSQVRIATGPDLDAELDADLGAAFDDKAGTAYADATRAEVASTLYLVSARHARPGPLGAQNPFMEPMPDLDTSDSRLIDTGFLARAIFPEAAFDFSHGAHGPAGYLGGGLLYYTLAYMIAARTCICLGSGGAFVPRLMRQAQRDIGLGAQGRTILVDGDRGAFGRPNWLDPASAFRTAYPEIDIRLADTVEAAGILAGEGVRIDYLHIDADHSREGCLRDFDAYLPLMRQGGLVTLHDTRPNAHASTTSWQAVDDIRARGFELLNLPTLASGVAILRI